MHIGELPMIIFTTVAQMSVGAFWILGIIQLIGRRAGVKQSAIDSLTNAVVRSRTAANSGILCRVFPSERSLPCTLYPVAPGIILALTRTDLRSALCAVRTDLCAHSMV